MPGSPEAAPLVWLPFPATDLTDPPEGLRYAEVVPEEGVLPEGAAEVELYVLPYRFHPPDVQILGQLPRLRVVQSLMAGVDAVVEHIPDGVTLCSGGGIHDASTAELAVGLTLASLRGLPGHLAAQQRAAWTPSWGESLADKRVVIIGAGRIAQAIRTRIRPFEVEVVLVGRTARDGVHAITELPQLLPTADVVILVVPGGEATRHLVDAGFLAAMRDGARLINVARGPVVDTDALLAELTTGRLHAAVDVTDPEPLPAEHPLWRAPNLIITPHVGGASSAMWPRARALVQAQLTRFAAGEPLANVVET